MLKPRKARTSPILILLYWSLALVLLATVASGLRADAAFGLVGLMRAPAGPGILIIHLASCLLLVAACILFLQRQRLEGSSSLEIYAPRSLRRINALVSQSFFALVALQALCALLLASGGGIGIARLHVATTLLMILAVPTHVALQFMIGGTDHGLRMLRPTLDRPGAVPLGRTEASPQKLRRALQSYRIFGLVLGVVFGAAAATALVGGMQDPTPGHAAGARASFFQVAWGLPLRPSR
jgi:hypothetical protein